MRASAGQRLAWTAGGVAVTTGGAALALFLFQQGLDNADKLSSVISMIIAVASLGIGVWSARNARRQDDGLDSSTHRTAPENQPTSTVSGPKFAVKRVYDNDTVIFGDRNRIEYPGRDD